MSRARELWTIKANLMADLVSLCKFFKKIRMQNPERIRSEFRRLRLIEKSYYELMSEIRKYNARVEDPRYEIVIQDKERFLGLFDAAKTAFYTFKVDFDQWRQTRVNGSVMSNITLPQFDGSIEGWVEFKTVFDAMVHSNTSLSYEEKFRYLKRSVKGEAYSVIKEYTREVGNYVLAYHALINRYDTPRRWIHFYVQQILKYKPTRNFNRTRFLSIHDAAFNTLKSMNLRDLTDYILFHLAYNNLDPSTRHSFDLAQEDPYDIPQTQDLLEFIRTLPKGNEMPRVFRYYRAAGYHYRGQPIHRKPQKSRCTFCNSNHFLAYCPNFRRRSIFEKIEFVKRRKLCTNCLGYHLLKDCLSTKTCWYCKRKHHSLLHNENRLPPQMLNDQSTSSNGFVNRQRNNALLLAVTTALKKSAHEVQQVRTVVAPASEATLDALVRRLKLARRNSATSVSGEGDTESTRTRRLLLLHFKSIYGSKANIVHALILRKLSKHIPRAITPRNVYMYDRNLLGENLNSMNLNQLMQKNGTIRVTVSLRMPRCTSSLINGNQLILSQSKLIKKNGSLRISLSLRMPRYPSLVSFKAILDWCTLKIETCPGYVCVTVALESGTVQIKTCGGYVVFTVIHPNGDLYNFLPCDFQMSQTSA